MSFDIEQKLPIPVPVTSDSLTGTFTPSGLRVKGLITVVSIDDTSWTALPAAPLTVPSSRNAIGIQNCTNNEIKLNFTDGIGGGYIGWKIPPNSEFFTDITSDVIIYGRAESGAGTIDITVMEIA